ncbi:MAG TPA: endonuclease III [Candidatus Obscuribacterales bacterium]
MTTSVKSGKAKKSGKPTGGKTPAIRAKDKTPARGKLKLVNKQTAQQMMDLLCRRYPDAHCELNYKNDFQLLVAVILSAQTTDVTVNKVTPELFKRFPTPRALAEAPPEAVKEIIRPTGYYNAKAANIQACAQAIVERFSGRVPTTLDELVTLPGVGRKTANVVLGTAHNVPGWSVDTHVQRLAGRLGLSKNTDPAKIEQDLQRLFPKQDWAKLSITLIWHGRRTCFARNPDCPGCPINHLCPSSLV